MKDEKEEKMLELIVRGNDDASRFYITENRRKIIIHKQIQCSASNVHAHETQIDAF